MSRWRLLLLIGGAAAYAVLSYWLMLFHAAEPWAVAALLGPLGLSAVGMAGARFGRAGLVGALLLCLGACVLVWRGEAGDPNRLYVLQHVAINLLLCGWFGSTLRPGQLSLIGGFAQRIRPLTPGKALYTRHLTMVWTGYFAAMAAASLLIYLLMPFDAWSFFSNLVSPACIAVLFVGEYLLRYRLHPEFERTSFTDVLRAVHAGSSGAAAER